MRTLCLNLHRSPKASIAENFLTFSPRVHFRDPGLVFLDISDTATLFGGEQKLIHEALQVSHEFFPDCTAAVANTPWAAQVFSSQTSEASSPSSSPAQPVSAASTPQRAHIIPPMAEQDELSQLPLSALTQLEGLIAWHSQQQIEEIIHFFEILGFQNIGPLRRFEIEAFRERWGHTGTVLWRRLHGLDKQVISPLLPSESLLDYVYLDYPVSLLSFLLHCLEKSLRFLFSRLHGRQEFAQRLILKLYCEFSEKVHVLELRPAQPSRDLELFMKLMENKLADVELDNPIREFEIEIIPCPERLHQLDFFEPRQRETDRLNQLMSLFSQSQLTCGYLSPQNEIMPEDSWSLSCDFEEDQALIDTIEKEYLRSHGEEREAFQIKPAYAKALRQAPRPARLLEAPKPLSDIQVQRLHFLSHHPIESLEEGWWETSRGRDYYFALSTTGQSLWVFYDHLERQYFLHGFFD